MTEARLLQMGRELPPDGHSGRLLTVALPVGKSADLVTPGKDRGQYAWRLAGNSQPLRSLEKLERAE
jgi:hypothetical protein